MRILHIIDYLGFGGAQTVLKGIFERQQDNQNIFLFALRQGEKTINIAHKNVITYHARRRYSFAPLKEIRKLIVTKNINILHCHLFRSQVFGLLLKKYYFPHITLIFHEQGPIMGSDANTIRLLEDYCYERFIRRTSKQVDVYIAVSNAIKNKLIERGRIPLEKIVVLPNSVDLTKFNAHNLCRLEREKLGIQKDDFVVGFAGRIIQRKGWKEYIDAAYILSRAVPKIKFLISGDGKEKNEMFACIHHYHIQENIIFLGYTPDMLQFYSCLDCFVLPSHWEGLALTQLEVMALGIPLITADGPGMNEIPQNNIDALFFKVKDAKDLAAKISKLYHDNELRKQLSKNSVTNVRQYSLDNTLPALNHIYHNCLNRQKLWNNYD